VALHVKHEKGEKMPTAKTVEELEKELKELKKENDKLSKPFDSSKLTDDDFAKIFTDERIWKNERFKELNDKAKKGETLAKLQAEADEKKLLEEKKFQEVIDLQKTQIEGLTNSVNQVKIDAEIRNQATKLGAVDADIIVKLIDKKNVVLNADGSIQGAAEAVKALTTEKPFLIGKPVIPTLGGGINPAGGGASPKFKLSETQNPAFYKEHEKEILEAMKTNNIENDLPMGIKS
jgi:myosin heavy subunit